MSNFVHLNCHSEYSIVDGILRIKPFVERVAKFGMQAVALTDQSNLFAMVKFYKAAIAAGVKPIIGCDVWLDHGEQRLTLLCQDNTGLHNLMRLISKSYNNWQSGKPILNRNWLVEDNLHIGLIAIAPMLDSDIGRCLVKNDLKSAINLTKNWVQLFGDRFYLAITRVGNPLEEQILPQILEIAAQDIPIVATADVRFLERDDFIAHEARVCINQGLRLDEPTRKKVYTEQQYLKQPEKMVNLFADLPESLENTIEIVKRCNVRVELGKTYLPNYQTPNGSSEQYLVETAENGLVSRLNCHNVSNLPAKYAKRLAEEIAVINSMGFAGYFLIVADIIQWSLQQGIPVGPGRGSGAGSLVAFALQITNIDPLAYDLLFERFLNPERVSMPDFDIDFCINGRDLVIEYVARKYGQGSVAQIITYGTMAAKAAIRDVGRVLGIPYGFVDQIAKLIPLELGITIDKALEQEAILKAKYEEDDEVKSIIDLARKLEGITRNVGKHAGGLVIAPKPIVNFSPLYRETNEASPVTQFDKNDIEDIGLVKFDFLGLRTLTIIDWAVKAININNINNNNTLLDINKIALDDPKTFATLCGGNTTAIFQLESRGMRELTVKLQPNFFEDLIAIGALYRPGPLQSGMVDDFIDRKRGKKAIQYPHPDLASILQATYGVIVYQEQVMQIAQILAGYTLGAADLLRRAMGKKKSEEMAKQREIFVKGAASRGVNETQASNIFDLMEKFSKYGFPKPHATAYALITYQTAWLKTYYPSEFMAAVLSSELDNTDKILLFIVDCKKNGITITAPNINSGEYAFVATSCNTINYGLGAIKGVGEMAVNNIIAAREEKGKFRDLLDLCKKVDLHKVSRKTLEALIKSGALDCFNLHRAALLNYLETVIKIATKSQTSSKQQLNLFFDSSEEEFEKEFNMEFANDICLIWEKQELLAAEKQALGFYFSDHPLSEFEKELTDLGIIKFTQATLDKKLQKFAGLIVGMRNLTTKRGDKMAFVTLDDAVSRQEIVVFADLYNESKDFLKKDQLIIIEGEVSKDDYTNGFKIKCSKIMNLYDTRKKSARNLTIVLNNNSTVLNNSSDQIKQIIKNYPGVCPLTVHYKKSDILTKIKLSLSWTVDPKTELLKDLKKLPEIEDVYIDY
jgi:DNA polymerase-3 subunit alpha